MIKFKFFGSLQSQLENHGTLFKTPSAIFWNIFQHKRVFENVLRLNFHLKSKTPAFNSFIFFAQLSRLTFSCYLFFRPSARTNGFSISSSGPPNTNWSSRSFWIFPSVQPLRIAFGSFGRQESVGNNCNTWKIRQGDGKTWKPKRLRLFGCM